jgi:histidinol-phosphate aminotransferase
MYGINKFILHQERNDYSEHLSEFDYKIDCSMGSNPYGTWPGLECPRDLFSNVALYPHSDQELKEAIAKFYSNAVDLAADNITLTCGSIGAVLALNRMVLNEGKVILGIAPQFTAVVDDFVTYGAHYRPVYLRKEDNYRFNLDNFLEALHKNKTAYIYIDNPNNPTGQVIDLNDLEVVIREAQGRDSFVVIDEAYGDYMDNNNSAAKLIHKYDNLAVVRTFSKGFGAAGIRLGYIIAQKGIIDLVNKVNIPFSKNTIAEFIALKLLASDWIEQTKRRVYEGKKTLRAGLKVIKIAHTSDTTPISLLYCENEEVDLCQVLEQTGVRAISCAGYEGLDKNSIRLNIHENMPLLMECLQNAEKILTNK